MENIAGQKMYSSGSSGLWEASEWPNEADSGLLKGPDRPRRVLLTVVGNGGFLPQRRLLSHPYDVLNCCQVRI